MSWLLIVFRGSGVMGVGAATGSIYSDHIRGSGVITTQTILFEHREHHRAELQLVLSSFEFWH